MVEAVWPVQFRLAMAEACFWRSGVGQGMNMMAHSGSSRLAWLHSTGSQRNQT